MLTRLSVRNFKRFDEVRIDLSAAVVFIGPNNSGKTTALQALALWEAGLRQWSAKRRSAGKADASKAVTIGRKDLVFLPLPTANAMWRDLKVREGYREEGKTKARNVLIDIVVEGEGQDGKWACGFEFEYASEEFFYCRPLRSHGAEAAPARMAVPKQASDATRLAFLPPLGGMLMEEPLLLPGRVDVLLGSGRSGEVLRNLCYAVHERKDGSWDAVAGHMLDLFGIELLAPELIGQLGTIELNYLPGRTGSNALPITSAGLGMLQTLQLLSYLYLKPGTVLLLDEPDAHLEVLRQRQTYQVLVEVARNNGCQLICASHSEVVLNEAVDRDTVIAFVGKPHPVSGRQGSQVLKALRDYGFENYIQAEQTGWVLYLEGSTDLAILKAWAERLSHPAKTALARPFVHYLNTNLPSVARQHFNAVKEANPGLTGVALFDRLELQPQGRQEGLLDLQWSKREIENYFSTPNVLLAFARGSQTQDLIESSEAQQREDWMREAIDEVSAALETLGEALWSDDRKASEQVLPQVLQRYKYKSADFRVPSGKGEYYTLIDFQSSEWIDPEVTAILNAIHETFLHAQSKG